MFANIFRILPNSIAQKVTAAYFTVQTWRTVGFRGTHSAVQHLKMTDIDIQILPALQDNYMYLIIDKTTQEAAIVDPVNPNSVIEAVKNANVILTKVLTTHHHWDHAGGNEQLVTKFKINPLKVYGGDERIGALTDKVQHGDKFSIGNLNVTCLFTPCHTTGHVCYYITSSGGEKVVFTGDTLFLGGCGRFFEGNANDMYDALINKLSTLPDETKVFCGHEYTLQNLAFGISVEPLNDSIFKKIEWAKIKRNQNIPTVPSTIGEEKLINPFMRVNEKSVQIHVGMDDPIKTMDAIRKEKDVFKSS